MKEVGTKTTEKVYALGRSLTGIVVYNDPKGYFYTVEFRLDGGTFRESYSAYPTTCTW